MKANYALIIFISILNIGACKSAKHTSSSTTKTSETKTVQTPVKNAPAPYPVEPSTCMMKGVLLKIKPTYKEETDAICNTHPCHALVVLSDIGTCGFGVPNKPNYGDTLDIYFTRTLDATDKLEKDAYPSSIKLTGIKEGQEFEAQVHIQMALGDKNRYSIYNYEILR